MEANPLKSFITPEQIAGFIEMTAKDSSLEQKFIHPAINVIQDEHVRKVYALMVLFAASAFMQSGIDGKSLLSKAFAIAKTISPHPLDAGEMKELMQQSITSTVDNLNQHVQDLRQHDLTLPLLFHLFHMADGAMNSEIEKRLLAFAEKFDLAATMQDVLHGSTPQERAAIFDAKLNEQKLVQDDEKRAKIQAKIRAKGRQLEESLNGASPRKRYTELYLFYKENNFREDMLNNSDALYRLALEEDNLSEAIQWLCKSIELNDSPERREQLMELYQRQNSSDEDADNITPTIKNHVVSFIIEHGIFDVRQLLVIENLPHSISSFLESLRKRVRLFLNSLLDYGSKSIGRYSRKTTESMPEDSRTSIDVQSGKTQLNDFRDGNLLQELKKKECSSETSKQVVPPSKEKATSRLSISGCVSWIILVFIVLVGIICFIASSNSSKDSLKDEPKQIVEEKVKIEETRPDYIKSQKTDLSLGGVDIGIDVIKLHEILGTEKAEEKNGSRTILKYDHIDVELQDGKVYSIISNNADALTLRGIHKGSTLQDITIAYGEVPSNFNSGNLSMNEYKFNSLDNRGGILRFAVNKSSNTVDYISVRIPDSSAIPLIPKNTENVAQEKTRTTHDLPETTQTSKTKGVYKRFTDDVCGFSFDYPDVGQDLEQEPGNGYKYYTITLKGKADVIFGSQPTNYASLEEASHEIDRLVSSNSNIKKLDDVTCIETRDNNDRDHIWEKTIYVVQNGYVQRRFIRAIKRGAFQDYSDIEETYQHLIESFQP